jgi:hypothetical protein
MMSFRAISWLKGAQRDFEEFPAVVRIDAETALTLAARGGKADSAKPFKGVDGGVFEIALKHRGNAYRIIYAVQIRNRRQESKRRKLMSIESERALSGLRKNLQRTEHPEWRVVHE